jgi:hypothetical protein
MIKELLIIFITIGTGCAVNEIDIQLAGCNDPNIIMDLQKLLSSYHYTKQYGSDFNCVEFTVACMQFLKSHKYDAYAMVHSWTGDRVGEGHCYPVVKVKNGWVAIDSSDSKSSGFALGWIMNGRNKNFDYLKGIFINNTTELIAYDSGPAPVYTGDLTRFIVKNN